MSAMLDSHKATAAKHLQESTEAGMPLEMIHKELLEIFSEKGKYSMAQITAVTSWLRSAALQERRVNDLTVKENDSETSEDIDFQTEAKIKSREWHFQKFVEDFSLEQRKKMKLLFMPGRNTFDIEAALKIGIEPENMITYIRGDSPAANAEYIRNTRRFGITNRRIGDLEENLHAENQILDGAYLDFFGQFCPAYHKILQSLPVNPNGEIRVGINIMEGREHAQTSNTLRVMQAIKENHVKLAGVLDEKERLTEMRAIEKNEREHRQVNIRDAREDVLRLTLFSGIGVANEKNWLLQDELKKFAQSGNEHPNWDELSPIQRFEIINQKMNIALQLFGIIDNSLRQNGVRCSLSHLGTGTRLAVVNSPVINRVDGPERYVSPNGHRPFISYSALLQTHQEYFKQFERSMSFFLRIATSELPKALQKSGLGYFSTSEGKTGKILEFYSGENKLIDALPINTLLEAEYGLTQIHSEKPIVGFTEEENDAVLEKVLQAVKNRNLEEVKNSLGKTLATLFTPINNDQRRGGSGNMRNLPCICGSGKKYKKCCGG